MPQLAARMFRSITAGCLRTKSSEYWYDGRGRNYDDIKLIQNGVYLKVTYADEKLPWGHTWPYIRSKDVMKIEIKK
jgi:hypothetical protein